MAEIKCIDCITDKTVKLSIKNHRIEALEPAKGSIAGEKLYVGPGLVDLQVNGYNSVDFNSPPVSEKDIGKISHELYKEGVTTFFPTVITNSKENMMNSLKGISRACRQDASLDRHIGGIHLEGPFISKDKGARGAHPLKYITSPDWDLFERFQDAAEGMIKIITLSPEWDSAVTFIQKCIKSKIIVSIGHSIASPAQIRNAIKAGAVMSTHLGNGAPQFLHRNSNLIWEQLASEKLAACIIADGFHLPESFIKSVIRIKKTKAIIVSDSTMFTGMAPGIYESPVGGQVVLDDTGRLFIKDKPEYLAGAAFPIKRGINHLLQNHLANLREAWSMASINPVHLLNKHSPENKIKGHFDLVIFKLANSGIEIKGVFKSGDEISP
ncbi:MAG: amidohydrolase family protein [Spirochaetales bacterium]|nr:amidohydrolase family protein [Spirochaetales bacterium]